MRYLTYLLCGLLLMAPQEWVVNLYKASRGKTPFHHFYYALMFWAVMLSLAFLLRKRLAKRVRGEMAQLLIIGLTALTAGFAVEWGLLGNSPWANPNANQFGLVAGWVSMFLLPWLFTERGFGRLKLVTGLYYLFFLWSIVVPTLNHPQGPLRGVAIYGYTVIPFLLLSAVFLIQKGVRAERSQQRASS